MILHLTGSHYFGTATPGSDVDFYAEDCAKNRAVLERLGFQQLTHKLHPAANTTAVYWRGDIRVHVQLVRDAQLKERTQRLMRDCGFGPYLKHKATAYRLWLFAYSLAAELEQSNG